MGACLEGEVAGLRCDVLLDGGVAAGLAPASAPLEASLLVASAARPLPLGREAPSAAPFLAASGVMIAGLDPESCLREDGSVVVAAPAPLSAGDDGL